MKNNDLATIVKASRFWFNRNIKEEMSKNLTITPNEQKLYSSLSGHSYIALSNYRFIFMQYHFFRPNTFYSIKWEDIQDISLVPPNWLGINDGGKIIVTFLFNKKLSALKFLVGTRGNGHLGASYDKKTTEKIYHEIMKVYSQNKST